MLGAQTLLQRGHLRVRQPGLQPEFRHGQDTAHGIAEENRIGGFHVDVMPRRSMLVLTNHDVPGVIGRVGTLLGDAGVNIAEYHQARMAQGGEALAAITVDSAPSAEVCSALMALPDITSATVVRFRE